MAKIISQGSTKLPEIEPGSLVRVRSAVHSEAIVTKVYPNNADITVLCDGSQTNRGLDYLEILPTGYRITLEQR